MAGPWSPSACTDQIVSPATSASALPMSGPTEIEPSANTNSSARTSNVTTGAATEPFANAAHARADATNPAIATSGHAAGSADQVASSERVTATSASSRPETFVMQPASASSTGV